MSVCEAMYCYIHTELSHQLEHIILNINFLVHLKFLAGQPSSPGARHETCS